MGTILSYYCRFLKVLAVALLVVMVTLVFANVVLRYAFNSGITVSEELSRWLFVWLTFLGSIYALRERQHLGTDVLVSRLGPRMRMLCLLIGYGFMLWVCWLLFSGALAQTRLNWNVTAPSSGMSLAWFYMSGVVFSVSAALVLIEQVARLVHEGSLGKAAAGEGRS
jgi:TRAP-type C4-dicarboxylate transport system permease small subunit